VNLHIFDDSAPTEPKPDDIERRYQDETMARFPRDPDSPNLLLHLSLSDSDNPLVGTQLDALETFLGKDIVDAVREAQQFPYRPPEPGESDPSPRLREFAVDGVSTEQLQTYVDEGAMRELKYLLSGENPIFAPESEDLPDQFRSGPGGLEQ
jgi:hypothetical protein